MCPLRFAESIVETFSLDNQPELNLAAYNIALTQSILIVTQEGHRRMVGTYPFLAQGDQ